MNFNEVLNRKVENIESIMEAYLPQEEGYQKTVISAMNYSLRSGGKRIRPMLMQQVYESFGGKEKIIEPFMAALEMIHTYSLVHDDLPAMDNDEYRRGRKTTHVVYGEGMAVLAGDGLLNYAFETAMKAFELIQDEKEYKKVAAALQILAKKAGIYGMIGGQCTDIEAEEEPEKLDGDTLLFIHENKTAALIQAAMMIGAILADATEQDVNLMEKCAYNIGVAFQIQDDILDVEGTMEELGKPIGSDEKNNKQTYVSIFGLEKAKQDVSRLSMEAIQWIGEGKESEFLRELVTWLIHRTK